MDAGNVLERAAVHLNRRAYTIGRWGLGDFVQDANGLDDWVYDQWRLELYLAWGWLGISMLVGPSMLVCAMLGNVWRGNAGNWVGLSIGTSVVSFAIAGSVVHLAHMVSLRAYWIAASRPRSMRPSPWTTNPSPSARTRRFLASAPTDLIIQFGIALATLAILLHMTP